tara:strand:- start:3282 stop:3479 length:198 start_codon:yes stop_codon:yes gene_type:complete
MLTITNYITAFWTVVVMNCIQPVNWKACAPVHEWLLPELEYAWKLKTGEIVPYQNEKDVLKKINN